MAFSVGVGDSEPLLTIDFLSAQDALEMVEQAQISNARIVTITTDEGKAVTIAELREAVAKAAVAAMRGPDR